MSDLSTNSKSETNSLSRREVLIGLSAVTAATLSGNALAGEKAQDHSKHDHSKHTTQQPDVLTAVNNCLDKGQRCVAHCLVAFQEGNTELADCAVKANEMHAVCDAFSYLLASNSAHIKQYAQICAQVCQECEEQCLEHKEHMECKACAEACADLVDQIKLRLS
jgi:Cys-rich four helix bundle protein (predicted Tat secretion target)